MKPTNTCYWAVTHNSLQCTSDMHRPLLGSQLITIRSVSGIKLTNLLYLLYFNNCVIITVIFNILLMLFISLAIITYICIYTSALSIYCAILYLLHYVLHVSPLKIGHDQRATSVFDVYSC